MSADSRSTHTDALETLGFIHTSPQARDAIHLGVEPAVAGELLEPGSHVYLENGVARVSWDRSKKAVGIVDPFLTSVVNKGESFWLIVYPRQITSLRHVWEHPDFPLSQETNAPTAPALPAFVPNEAQLHEAALILGDPVAQSLEWIRNYAKELSNDGSGDEHDMAYGGTVTADELIEKGMEIAEGSDDRWGTYLSKGGLLEGQSTSPEFWEKLAILKGIEIPDEKRGNFFSCSC